MKEFIITKLMFWVTTLITATAADNAPGIYCSNKAQTWIEAVIGCQANGGRLVSYYTDMGKPIANLSLNRDEDIWTADYATNNLKEDSHVELCGFVYFDNTTWPVRDTFYGDCYRERYYFCRNDTTSTLDVFQSTHSGIKINCIKPVNNREFNWLYVKPGFYWTMDTYEINTVSEKGRLPPSYNAVLCGAYTAKIGKYFIKCDTRRHSLCQMPDNDRGSLDKSCFSDLAVSMHGTESYAVSTSIGVLSAEKKKLENELDNAKQDIQGFNQTIFTLGQQLEDSQQVARDLVSEIADLKHTITGLKGSLNLSRSETRAIMNENATLKIKLFNTNSSSNGERKGNDEHYSDVSDQENNEEGTNHQEADDDIQITFVEASTNSSGNILQNSNMKRSNTGKGGPFKRTRHS